MRTRLHKVAIIANAPIRTLMQKLSVLSKNWLK